MSHELRTPIDAVIGMTSLLLDSTLDHQPRDYVETVRTSGEHLLTIINDIATTPRSTPGSSCWRKWFSRSGPGSVTASS